MGDDDAHRRDALRGDAVTRRLTAAEAQALLVGSAEMVAANVLHDAPALVESLAATEAERDAALAEASACLLYTSPSPRDA